MINMPELRMPNEDKSSLKGCKTHGKAEAGLKLGKVANYLYRGPKKA